MRSEALAARRSRAQGAQRRSLGPQRNVGAKKTGAAAGSKLPVLTSTAFTRFFNRLSFRACRTAGPWPVPKQDVQCHRIYFGGASPQREGSKGLPEKGAFRLGQRGAGVGGRRGREGCSRMRPSVQRPRGRRRQAPQRVRNKPSKAAQAGRREVTSGAAGGEMGR